ncbi:MAG: hypothetical protein LC130_23125 [Bryobacterales bacterium]|nr:hypothetical protein [Bryobacterales bacterium]
MNQQHADPLSRLVQIAAHPATPESQRQWQLAYLDLLIEQSRHAIAVEARRIVEYETRKQALREDREAE